MRPALPFSYPGIAGDIDRLASQLRLLLDAAEWSAPDSVAILNLACGRADETGVLLSTAAPLAGRRFYLGIDLRAPEIAEAKRRWMATVSTGDEINFRCGDASRTDRMASLPAFDLIFIRHQNFWSDVPVWTRLYRNAIERMKDHGTLIITSYFDREHELASACLGQLGLHRVSEIRHFASRELPDAPGKSVDRWLAAFRKASI
ncbi:MAG: class I SAM-dependent methyltransferase [Akkermansiaceae bacterium]|jgi:hypothetical protein|nr:class I SAM-dependent methyltransferase [Akkermansiaceae bacterium]